MSINELIATSSVHAFNSGVASGRALEQERDVDIVKQFIALACPCMRCDTAKKILELIEARQK